MKRNITCILCPCGCALEVNIDGDKVEVTGNTCPKGARYGKEEVLYPVRTVTSVMRVANRIDTMVSVKTSVPIPKEKIFDVMKEIRACSVNAPVCSGDILIKDIFGADIIATKSID